MWLWPGGHGGGAAGDAVQLSPGPAHCLQCVYHSAGGRPSVRPPHQHLHPAPCGSRQQHPQSQLRLRVSPREDAPLYWAGLGLFHRSGDPSVPGRGGAPLLDKVLAGWLWDTTRVSPSSPQAELQLSCGSAQPQRLAGGFGLHHHHGASWIDLCGVHHSLLPLASAAQNRAAPSGDRGTAQNQGAAGRPRARPAGGVRSRDALRFAQCSIAWLFKITSTLKLLESFGLIFCFLLRGNALLPGGTITCVETEKDLQQKGTRLQDFYRKGYLFCISLGCRSFGLVFKCHFLFPCLLIYKNGYRRVACFNIVCLFLFLFAVPS